MKALDRAAQRLNDAYVHSQKTVEYGLTNWNARLCGWNTQRDS
jgi:hypothetical protein